MFTDLYTATSEFVRNKNDRTDMHDLWITNQRINERMILMSLYSNCIISVILSLIPTDFASSPKNYEVLMQHFYCRIIELAHL